MMTPAVPLSIPVISFDVVHGCQLRCVGCPNSLLKPKVDRISIADFDRCLRNLDVKKIGLFRLFKFGEPLLHPDLAGLLARIPEQSWQARQVEISTNAQTVDWDAFEAAIRAGVLTRLVVSCDGDGTAEDYERLRPPGRWSRLMDFLSRAREVRDRLDPGVALITRTICTDPAGQARWRDILGPLGWTPQFRPWLPLPDAVRLEANPPRSGQGLCFFLENRAFLGVDWDGSVVPCCMHPGAPVIGNLKEQRYSQIVMGAARRKLMDDLVTDRGRIPVCSACPLDREFMVDFFGEDGQNTRPGGVFPIRL